ncbi:hypothetical protein IF1G_04187 [Cordyceps javanica]|uniref:Uncharacterized protein n=1 Tax=Cordyceps javanica TaxID=43265 RepID=A0A545V5F3_9HYPO|nr:hypothetical protein IF1G_04187 [Cordyceps javanica]TQW08204.1 hypothetical protein IF2G_04080 [Cordyceps javanica]
MSGRGRRPERLDRPSVLAGLGDFRVDGCRYAGSQAKSGSANCLTGQYSIPGWTGGKKIERPDGHDKRWCRKCGARAALGVGGRRKHLCQVTGELRGRTGRSRWVLDREMDEDGDETSKD